MKIAVVGATGRIGEPLTRTLLAAGHQVKALSRGGPALDALVELGTEPFLGSFDTGAGELGTFFQDADAAFLMVKTDWNNLHGHYPVVAQRFVDALSASPVKLVVNLTAIGSDAPGDTGHFAGFYELDNALNTLSAIDIVHLRAGWFMENLFAWTGAVAKHDAIGWSLNPDLKALWVATRDIADIASKDLTNPTSGHRVIRELGQALTMPEIAAIIGKEIDRPVEYRFVDRDRQDIEAEYLKRFGTAERWLDDNQTLGSLNDGRVRYHEEPSALPTDMETFIREVWKPYYLKVASAGNEPETFYSWSAQPNL